MKCLRKYKWVKLPRKEMPELKGRLGYWLKLAESAAFCKGIGTYCGHKNPVEPGMWAGGSVIYSRFYPTCDEIQMPEEESVMRIFRKILICAKNTHTAGSVNERGNRYTAWKSRRVIKAMEEQEQNESGENAPFRMSLELALHFLPYITCA